MSYNTDNYMEQGGANLVIGGTITIDGTAYPAATLKTLLTVISALPVENVASPAIWNDAGVLKVGTV